MPKPECPIRRQNRSLPRSRCQRRTMVPPRPAEPPPPEMGPPRPPELMGPPEPQPAPNPAAADLLQDPAFQEQALSGAECTDLGGALQDAAGNQGGTLSVSPGEGATTVQHPTQLGVAESNFHQVFTDGNYVFDPVYSTKPIPIAQYIELIQDLSGGNVEISQFPAKK
jgi:filamentous hemagglutinin